MKRSLLILITSALLCGGCGMDVVGMAKRRAKEQVAKLGVSGKAARFAAAEWLDQEADTHEFYTATVEPKISDLYTLGCKGLAKQLRQQKAWYEVLGDFAIGFLTFWTGTSA